MWLKGGDERKLLLQRLQEAGLDKASCIITLAVCIHDFHMLSANPLSGQVHFHSLLGDQAEGRCQGPDPGTMGY